MFQLSRKTPDLFIRRGRYGGGCSGTVGATENALKISQAHKLPFVSPATHAWIPILVNHSLNISLTSSPITLNVL
jgi:hypothetical protein